MAVILLDMIWRFGCTVCGRNLGAAPYQRPQGGTDLAHDLGGPCPDCGGFATWDLRFLWWKPVLMSDGRIFQRMLDD